MKVLHPKNLTRSFLTFFICLSLVFTSLQLNTVVRAAGISLQLEGFQISTVSAGSRVLYSVIDPEQKVVSRGLIYGLAGYAARSDMTYRSSADSVVSYQSTSAGEMSSSLSSAVGSRSYTMTMKFIPSVEYYKQQLLVRAYAVLSDGSVVYSSISYFSVYQIADSLYQNCKMNNKVDHDYLYNNILALVDPDYKTVEYNKTQVESTASQETTRTQDVTEDQTTSTTTTDSVTTTTIPVTTTTTVTVTTTTTVPVTTTTTVPVTTTTTVPVTTTSHQIETTASYQQETTAFDESSLSVPDASNASGAPNKSTVKVESEWGNTSYYTVTSSMWWGNNATRYICYERKGQTGSWKMIDTNTLTDNSSNAQTISVVVPYKTIPGTYYYKFILKNKVNGTIYTTETDEASISIGGSSSSKIVLDTIDADEIVNQYVMSQGTFTYTIDTTEFSTYSFSVISSNTSVAKASIVNGNQLKIEAVSGGRTGIKITENTSGEIRQFGIRVREADGSLSALPSYLALGQVSEDTSADLAFWDDTDTDDTNKRIDIRYIYVNGGPINGWQSWADPSDPGKRVSSYIKESLKRGIIPYFVYYNIPDGSESYDVDLTHINDSDYMAAYYKDLTFFLSTCEQYANGETVGIVLEPDFIGYMMQNSGLEPSQITAAGVEAAYTSGILTHGTDPEFPNTLVGLVESINYIIKTKYPAATFGWQFNTWSYSEGVPGTGLMHATETMGLTSGREFIKNAAIATANYYKSAGILTYGASFISIDKYGLDGAYEGNADNPSESRWLWNSDLWTNYLYYAKALHETTNMPVTLWQLPVGHLNTSQSVSPYTGSLFPDLTNTEQNYEDSAPTYFFGDTFYAGNSNRLNYFGLNAYNDSKVTVTDDYVTYGSHMQEAADAGVTCILFGAGVGASTDAVGNPPGDSYWWITKAQEYYKNPIMLR